MAVDLSKNEDLQRLFLLELLVDSVKFDYKKIDLDKSLLDLLRQTCVRFNFLNFPVIEVCEEDFCQTQGDYKATEVVFKNGKSCFFSLSGLPINTECLKIGATIVRKKNEPPPVVLGTTCIQLDKSFVNVLNNYNHINETGEACKSLKDLFPIFDDKGIMIGTITLFVRLSCFGKAIITHFKIPQENETGYLFKNTNDPDRTGGETGAIPLNPILPGPSGQGNVPGPSAATGRRDNPGMRQMPSGMNSHNCKGDIGLGNMPKMVPGGVPAMFPGAMPGMIPGGMPGMFPGGMPGIFPGGMPGGEPGIQASPYGYGRDFMPNMNRAEVYPEIGMGEHMGIVPYSSENLLPALKCNIENQIRKEYQELSVTINGHEFSINVIRKSRKKKEKAPEFQICGKIPGKESSDSEETIEDESVIEIEEEHIEKKEYEKETEISTTQILTVESTETKPTKVKTPEPQITYTPIQPQNISFGLCECDIPLPKGFRIPDSILHKSTSHNNAIPPSTPPISSPSPVIIQAPQSESPPRIATPNPGTPITQAVTPIASSNPPPTVLKKKKERKNKETKEKPKTYCLQPNCPMGFAWPPGIPQETKIIKVPCCSQLPMHPGSVGLKGDQVVFQLADPQTSSFALGQYNVFQKEPNKSPYALKLGAANLTNSKSTKMIMELPAKKQKIKKVKTNEIDTQYLETDLPPDLSKVDNPKKTKDKKKGAKAKGGKKGKKK